MVFRNIILVLCAVGVLIVIKQQYDHNQLLQEKISELQTVVQKVDERHSRLKKSLESLSEKLIYYKEKENIKLSKKDYDCLVRNIAYEAGAESHAGKIAVAQITHNRIKSGKWGKSFCSVIYSPYQFSWTLDDSKRHKNPTGGSLETSKIAVDHFLHGARVVGLENSMFYHGDYISTPKWAKKMEIVAQIGKHVFYVHNGA